MSPKIDFAELWKNKAEGAPKQSIISSLQKLLTEKDESVYNLQNQLNALKERMGENVSIMEAMEAQFTQQKARIEQLESQGGGAPKVLKPTVSNPTVAVPAGDQRLVDQLKRQVSDMENKLYIFSHLPDRITDLESKLEKQNKVIEQYDDNEKKLRDQMRKLTADGSQQVIQELEQKLQTQIRETNQIRKQLEDTKNAKPTNIEEDMEVNGSAQLEQVMGDRNRLQTQVTDLLAKLEAARKTIMTLQNQSTNKGDSAALQLKIGQLENEVEVKNTTIMQLQNQMMTLQSKTDTKPQPDLALGQVQLENTKLKAQVDEMKEKSRAQQLKMEELIEHVQQAGKGEDLAVKVTELTHQLEGAQQELAKTKATLESRDKQLNQQSGGDLITSLNLKIEKLTAMNKKLEDEVKKAASAPAKASPSIPSIGSKFAPAAPKIREIGAESSKEADQKLTEELNQLRKQIAEKDTNISKLTQELTEVQTQMAESKAAGPQDGSNSNMMSLLTDLQSRIKKMKEQIRQKDEEIAKLKGQ